MRPKDRLFANTVISALRGEGPDSAAATGRERGTASPARATQVALVSRVSSSIRQMVTPALLVSIALLSPSLLKHG